MRNKISLIILVLSLCVFALCAFGSSNASSTKKPRLGVWITVFSEAKVFHSKENADKLIKTCSESGINDIYVQVYRANKAYYNSDITDKSVYEELVSKTGEDILPYLINQAKKNNIKIHAWINLLSIAQNKDANILKKLGNAALTMDQHGRYSMAMDKKDSLDDYYIRENQLFLEPGNPQVRKYLVNIAEEVIKKYPGFDGLHCDYIRYPSVVPFIPGSRFSSHGISYGYGDINTERFKKNTGIDIKTMDYSREGFRLWDKWRRDNVTALVRDISKRIHKISPDIEMSCTIVPSIERTYLITFQDWIKWLREDYIDYVAVMSYTDDMDLMEQNSRSLLFSGVDDKIHIGVGAYLMKDKPENIKKQIKLLQKVSPAGIIIFSYDDIADNKSLRKFLSDNFRK